MTSNTPSTPLWLPLPTLMVAAIGLAAGPAGAASREASIPVELRVGERVTAVAVEDDSSGWVVVADTEGWSSRLLHFRAGMPPRWYELPDLAVNRLNVIRGSAREEPGPDGEASLFVSGAERRGAEGRYVYRLLRVHGPKLETVWASALLRDSADAIIRTDSDGDLWGALQRRGDAELDLAVGPIPGYRPTMTVSLQSSWEPGHIPRSVSSDFPTFVFLGSDARSPVLAILWQNLVHVVAPGEDPVRAVIGIESPGAANLHWQPSRRTLWVGTSEGFLGYRIPPDIASRCPGGSIPVCESLTGGEGGPPPMQIFPLHGGGVAVGVRTENGTRELRMPVLKGATARHGRAVLAIPRGAWVDLSPSGDVALLLPDGPHSDTAHLFRIPPPNGS